MTKTVVANINMGKRIIYDRKLKNAKSKIDLLVIDNTSIPTQMEDFDANINE